MDSPSFFLNLSSSDLLLSYKTAPRCDNSSLALQLLCYHRSPQGGTEIRRLKQALKHRRTYAILLLAFVILAECTITLTGAVDQSDWVPRTVDLVRSLPFVGPERIAAAEDLYYQIQDIWDRTVYGLNHHATEPSISENVVPSVAVTPSTGTSEYADRFPDKPITPTPVHKPTSSSMADQTSCPRAITPIVLTDPQAGEGSWTANDMPLQGRLYPALCHTFVRPDPERPYARVDMVRIDLTQTNLSLVAGTVEPKPIDGIPGPGQVPLNIQKSGKLVAAWNGGFLTMHGASGMMVNQRIILPPKDGLATLALYADGRVKLGEWGKDITLTPALLSFRQNGPMLVDQGEVKGSDFWTWGKSVSGGTYIWRSGLGMTPDGKLVVAVGNSLSARTLGEALRMAGVNQAMQLDVNAWHVFFFTYDLKDAMPVATKLNRDMPGGMQTFLRPYDRDFMYLTTK